MWVHIFHKSFQKWCLLIFYCYCNITTNLTTEKLRTYFWRAGVWNGLRGTNVKGTGRAACPSGGDRERTCSLGFSCFWRKPALFAFSGTQHFPSQIWQCVRKSDHMPHSPTPLFPSTFKDLVITLDAPGNPG